MRQARPRQTARLRAVDKPLPALAGRREAVRFGSADAQPSPELLLALLESLQRTDADLTMAADALTFQPAVVDQ